MSKALSFPSSPPPLINIASLGCFFFIQLLMVPKAQTIQPQTVTIILQQSVLTIMFLTPVFWNLRSLKMLC